MTLFQFNILLTFVFIAIWMRLDDRVEVFFAVIPEIIDNYSFVLWYIFITQPIFVRLFVTLFGSDAVLYYLSLRDEAVERYGEPEEDLGEEYD